jgi:UDP-N-acetylglucosamine diphosphorylase / glucose-1-phosphate thymidylyltransferase / UDP-N-acetylgalactosamine diphosphorylase / glucosamine-1-phosphate N-acetyltransferase / galactosamine-1-phosphate N-acetyltransferase
MQCVIICAGKGTRMRPLTDTIAKPLITICGKPILEHIVDALPAVIDEIILVVGYRKEQIEDFCGTHFKGRKITYVVQENFAGGTGEALMCTKDVIADTFLFMYGDDIHGKDALARIVEKKHAMLVACSDTPERFGVVVKNADGTLCEIIEKPENPSSNLINIGGFVLSPAIFSYDVAVHTNGELYATDMISAYAKDFPVSVETQELWIPIGYPEHIAAAEALLCPKKD